MEELVSNGQVDAAERYEPPRLEVIGSIHDLTQVEAKGGAFPDGLGDSFVTATVS